MDLAKKLLGAALALVGAAVLVVGVWFAAHLGGSGTATFELGRSNSPVVLGPTVLNRLDEPTTVRVVPASGSTVWVGVGAPSDVAALVGTTPRTRVTGVVVRDWALVARSEGSGSPVTPSAAEIWRQEHRASGPTVVDLDQASAPETVVVSGDGGSVDRIEVSWTHRAWFVESLVVAVVGFLVLVAGLAVLVVRLRPDRPADATPEEVTA